jgi:hypothetical protein
MREETWKALESMFARTPIMRAECVTRDEIDAASRALGIPFPEDYQEFVSRYGGAIVGPYRIFGLRQAAVMGKAEGSVVDETRHFQRLRWPGAEHWVVFSTDHAGNPIGFDRDGKIWISDHDFGVVEVIAENFEEYLRKRCLKLQ